MKKYKILVFVFFILLVGCTSVSPSNSTSIQQSETPFTTESQEFTTNDSSTPLLTSTVIPTVTTKPSLTSTPVVTNGPSPTSTYTSIVVTHEITIEPTLLAGQLEGTLILKGQSTKENDCLLNLQTMQCTDLPVPTDGFVLIPSYSIRTISPDHTQFAYLDYYQSGSQLHIVTAEGQQKNIANWIDGKQWQLIEWIDDQHLLMNELGSQDGLVREYSPYTSEWREITPSFPFTSENGKLWEVEWDILGPFVYYDPAQTRIVMLRHSEPQFYATYELWDDQTKKIVWSKRGSAFNSRPIWSRDGERFAVVIGRVPNYRGEEAIDLNYGTLYIIGNDGHETEVTGYVVGELSWSPDESKIATWWRGKPILGDDEYQNNYLYNPLAVVDLETREISVYTFSRYADITLSNIDQYPTWSPDGRYIAITNTDDLDDTTSSVIILDTLEKKAFEIIKDYWVRGWLKRRLE